MLSRFSRTNLKNRQSTRHHEKRQKRFFSGKYSQKSDFHLLLAASVGVTAVMTLLTKETFFAEKVEGKIDFDQVREDIKALLDNEEYDDGSYAPVLIRLAWHSSGTYDAKSMTGGSKGGTIRHSPGEADHGANAGLDVARALLEPLVKEHEGISYGDLYTLAGVVAIEAMGGPKVEWSPGRSDKGEEDCTPDGRLPDAAQGQDHIRSIFYRMGFNDREIVALSGAHAVGRCHTNRSGFSGPWTASPTMFTNDYFVQLTDNTWTPKQWDGPFQYEDPTGELMMLPTDIALIKDEGFKQWVEVYAEDQDVFFEDFAKAFGKLISLGV